MTWKYKNTVERRSKTSPTKYKSNSKFSFCTSKTDSGPQLVTNLKKLLNNHIPNIHLKMEGLFLLKKVCQKEYRM